MSEYQKTQRKNENNNKKAKTKNKFTTPPQKKNRRKKGIFPLSSRITATVLVLPMDFNNVWGKRLELQ